MIGKVDFPIASIELILNGGHDIKSVARSRPSISDEEVVKWAAEEERVILTFDKDYGEIVFRYKIKCAVVFFRTKEIMRNMPVKGF